MIQLLDKSTTIISVTHGMCPQERFFLHFTVVAYLATQLQQHYIGFE